MESGKKKDMIAWNIAYELMTRSYEPLTLFMLHPKQIIPIHTMTPDLFIGVSKNVVLKEDGISFKI